jgi:putative chitinase
LGNTQAGDGQRFRGAGDLQITGRANFAAARDRLRARWPKLGVPDFEAEPDKAGEPQWAAMLACDYIDRVKANQYADVMNFDAYADLINRGRVTLAPGDANGFQKRLALAITALRVLP